jgi:hypothetical protein
VATAAFVDVQHADFGVRDEQHDFLITAASLPITDSRREAADVLFAGDSFAVVIEHNSLACFNSSAASPAAAFRTKSGTLTLFAFAQATF